MSSDEIPLNVPDIGDTDKIELVSWNISAGQSVKEGQELCELVTDKAAFPLESPFSTGSPSEKIIGIVSEKTTSSLLDNY